MVDEEPVPTARPFQRTPLQVAILTFLTLGFYSFYWLTRTVRQARRILEREPAPWWYAIGLGVPVLNLLLNYQWFGNIAWAVRRAGLRPSVPYGFFIPVPLIFTIVGNKAPNPWFLLSFFYFVPFAVMAYDMLRAEMILQGADFPRPRLTVIEILVIVLGVANLAFIVAGTLLDRRATSLTPWVTAGVLAGVLALLVVCGLLSKRAENEVTRRGTDAFLRT